MSKIKDAILHLQVLNSSINYNNKETIDLICDASAEYERLLYFVEARRTDCPYGVECSFSIDCKECWKQWVFHND